MRKMAVKFVSASRLHTPPTHTHAGVKYAHLEFVRFMTLGCICTSRVTSVDVVLQSVAVARSAAARRQAAVVGQNVAIQRRHVTVTR